MSEEDLDFKALPKIELHAHLSGSISRQCLHDVWAAKKAAGQEVTLEDPLVVMPVGKHDYDLKTFFPLFSSYIYHLVNDESSLRATTRAVLADFAADGVAYLELRTTPRALPLSQPPLSKADYVQTILDTIRAFEEEQGEEDAAAGRHGLRTKLILSVDRRNTLAQAREVVALARAFAGRGVVGVDLCGDPAQGGVQALAPAFAEARDTPGLGLTLHFAEAEASGTDAELAALLSWGPDRIGHVIHVGEAARRGIVARGGMGLELCLSCNVHAGMITGGFEAHHFGDWWRVEECVVVLCTDDVGVFGSPLSNEYRLVAQHFKLTRKEICTLARKGIEVIFGGDEEKERLRKIMWRE
ncbi:Metallo-dependent hydrolase [Pleurostoma richardsiae]|uniref:Metallo-dependent hydrolase n=1 Tax=Pleurostoma richardsiae TaxID=41990 RepID=A0AA38RPW4_9PEZI|nr:Metallo-dependent hydrolase [Pleurostoma richardsiae]